MASRVLQRLARVAAAVLVVSLVLAGSAAARPTVPRTARSSRGFNLFAGSTNVVMNVNRVQCNINNIGESCVDPTNSPVLGGGFWPKGSPDQYIFNAGLQIAAIIPGNKTATFNWPGDTVGAFFFDPRGDQTTGEARTETFSSLRADDLANWPTAAFANDTSLYAATLIGRANVSQQDVWSRFWDGNVGLAAGARKHPMGILVESRGLAWNFPTGNEDIIYFITRFINITSGVRTDYDGLANSGYSTTDIDDIFAIAQDFRSRSQAAFNVQIPTNGFSWSNVYASFAEDPDVGNASLNYSNANLIFNMAMAWKSDFKETTWQFPPTMFGAPFLPAPGFESAKYLKTPVNPATGQQLGITMAGNTTNGAPFPDAVGVSRLWRNLSGNLLPTDGSCSVPNPQARRFCQWVQTAVDTRFYAASGPFTVAPGQLATIVVALVHAAPVGASPAATPTCAAGITCQALPAFSLTPFIGADMKPGLSIEGRRLGTALDTVRNLDRALGLLNFKDANGDSTISQTEVTTVPRSLLNKGLVAQNVFDNKFLLPFAPNAPNFFLVPGDNQVTIAWQKSTTETIGDPFFTVASNPLSPLYDPNFRKFDVEGYRIWRGRTQSEMEVVASFDYSSTTFKDYTAGVFNSNFPNCAPELGATFNGTTPCGTTYTTPVSAVNTGTSKHTDYDISGNLIQVPPGGRVQLANGTILALVLDTAVVGGGTGFPSLTDNDVPFAYTDHGVRNGFSYVYAVTAFDVNSLASGPSSLESPLVTKNVIPRVTSGAETPGTATLTMTGRNNTVLDPTAALPTIDGTTGIFSGPMPPSNGVSVAFASFLPYTAAGQIAVTIDSVIPSLDCGPLGGNCTTGTYFVTTVSPAGTSKQQISFVMEGTTGPSANAVYTYPSIPFLNTLAGRFGGDSTYSLSPQAILKFGGTWFTVGQGRGAANGFGSRFNGPRWWAGTANEALASPNANVCATLSSGGCVDTTGNGNASAAGVAGGKINGVLPNIQYLWSPEGYMTVTNPMRVVEILTGSVARAADFRVYWGATAGKVDSVIDVTHNVVVPFSPRIRASWGILNDSSFTNTPVASTMDGNNNFLTFTDVACVDPIPTDVGLCNSEPPATAAFLMNHAISNPMNFKPASLSGTGGAALVAQGATGNGFIFYLNGKFFVMQMTSTLAACCQNTVWNARFYAGHINGSAGSFSFTGDTRPPAVPGLTVTMSITGSTFNTAATNDSLLANVHTVPDPYYVTNALELTSNTKVLRFVNLPAQAIIRIYSSSGILVNILSHNDAGGGGEAVWNLRNRNNQFVASGVYFYHVEGPDGKTKIGRFTVVNYAQ